MPIEHPHAFRVTYRPTAVQDPKGIGPVPGSPLKPPPQTVVIVTRFMDDVPAICFGKFGRCLKIETLNEWPEEVYIHETVEL